MINLLKETIQTLVEAETSSCDCDDFIIEQLFQEKDGQCSSEKIYG